MALIVGKFDATGELYATLTADSRLRIWEAGTGNLRLEHTPTEHLADAYTCMAWGHPKVYRIVITEDILVIWTLNVYSS